jgi:hypothetical protein
MNASIKATAMTDDQLSNEIINTYLTALTQRSVRRYNSYIDVANDLYAELRQRGSNAIDKLLTHLDHQQRRIQCFVATQCYKDATAICRAKLLEIRKEISPAGSDAYAFLFLNDPAFRAEEMASGGEATAPRKD